MSHFCGLVVLTVKPKLTLLPKLGIVQKLFLYIHTGKLKMKMGDLFPIKMYPFTLWIIELPVTEFWLAFKVVYLLCIMEQRKLSINVLE